jgi:hypothetical protein
MSDTEQSTRGGNNDKRHAENDGNETASPKEAPQDRKTENPPPDPDHHTLNENLIATWTRRLGIFTALLVAVTALLVIATAISAYFLWESDVAIEGQLHELHEQNITIRAQNRANLALIEIQHDPESEHGHLVALEISPQWKNLGATDARDVKMGFNIVQIEVANKPHSAIDCPDAKPPSGPPRIIQSQQSVTQAAKIVSVKDIQRERDGVIKIFINGQIRYRDIFPDDPIWTYEWCVYLSSYDPDNNGFSFITVREKTN